MICALGARRKQGGPLQDPHLRLLRRQRRPAGRDTPTGPIEVGTVSYGGALCGLGAAPTVYSRVSASLDFINGH